MKQLKPIWLKGIVTIKVSGHYPERFFDLFARHGIPVWSIKKQTDLYRFSERESSSSLDMG